MHRFLHRFAYALSAVVLVATPAAAQSQTPVGVWLHANQRIQVRIAPCGETLCGKLVWLKKPLDEQGRPRVDAKNKDPEARSRPLLGMTVLTGLRRTAANMWSGGRIYNPDDGKVYQAHVSVPDPGTLQVRAFVGLSALGKTLTWTRVR